MVARVATSAADLPARCLLRATARIALRDRGAPRYREYARDIGDSARHLLSIINDILDVSKIEAGKLELHEDAVDIDIVIEDVLRLINERAETAGVELGPVLTITEEDGGYVPRYEAAAAPMAMGKAAPIEAGTTTVEVRLRVTWELR